MDQTLMRMLELDYNGYYCSQILMIMVLEAQGKRNPDLISAMGGLANGSGFTGGFCGCLTGAAPAGRMQRLPPASTVRPLRQRRRSIVPWQKRTSGGWAMKGSQLG